MDLTTQPVHPAHRAPRPSQAAQQDPVSNRKENDQNNNNNSKTKTRVVNSLLLTVDSKNRLRQGYGGDCLGKLSGWALHRSCLLSFWGKPEISLFNPYFFFIVSLRFYISSSFTFLSLPLHFLSCFLLPSFPFLLWWWEQWFPPVPLCDLPSAGIIDSHHMPGSADFWLWEAKEDNNALPVGEGGDHNY